jgi:hypothetical protein
MNGYPYPEIVASQEGTQFIVYKRIGSGPTYEIIEHSNSRRVGHIEEKIPPHQRGVGALTLAQYEEGKKETLKKLSRSKTRGKKGGRRTRRNRQSLRSRRRQ